MRRMFLGLFAVLSFSTFVLAAETNETAEIKTESTEVKVQDKTEVQVVEPVAKEADFRQALITIHYSQFDLIIPAKKGLALEWLTTPEKSWEFEYTQGSLAVPFLIQDLGSFDEDRFTFRWRRGGVSGFNWYYGLFYYRFKIHVGSEIMNRLSTGYYPSVDLMAVEGIGGVIGLGYRWLFKQKFMLGIDIATWSQPIFTTKKETGILDFVKDQNDRDNIDGAMKAIQYFPRIAVAKVVLGYNF